MSRTTGYLFAVMVAVYIPFALLEYAHFPYSDGAEHGAAIRALAHNTLHPGDPMLNAADSSSPRYVPSILLMALVMKLLNMDVIAILKLFLILFFILFLVAAALFSSEYFHDTGQASWSVAALLFLWGLGWDGANAYMFSAILYTAYFPSVVSFSLSLLALYFQLRFLRCNERRSLIAAVLLGALLFVNHPPTGTFFFVCSGLIYLEKKGLNKKAALCYLISIACALCLTSIWPYYNFFSALTKIASGGMEKTMDYALTRDYLYSMPLLRSGPALAGIPLLGFYLFQKKHLVLWGGFFIFSFIYLAGYYFKLSLAERSIFFVMFFLQMVVSRQCREYLYSSTPISSRNIKTITSWVLILLLAGGTVIQAIVSFKEFIHPAFKFAAASTIPRYINPNAMHSELKKYLKEGDVVLSDIYSSWSIPVYTGAKIIALCHTPPHINDNMQRIADVATFYKLSTSPEERLHILNKYGVTHIFLNFKIDGKELEPILKKMGFMVIAHTELFSVLSVFN